MKKAIIITILLSISSIVVLAQDRPKTNAKADSIIKIVPMEVGGHNRYAYTINGKIQTSDEVKARLYAYAPSKVELLKYSKQTSWLGVSVVGFGISGIGATLLFINKNGSDNPTTNHHNLTGAYVFCGTATALIFASIFHGIKAHKHANKSLLLYNQQYQ